MNSKEKYDVSFRVTAIATNRHGRAIDPNGIDLEQALKLSADGKKLDELSKVKVPQSNEDFIIQSKADILLENSPVNYENGEPARPTFAALLKTTCMSPPPTKAGGARISRIEKAGRTT
jgi:hypothetical protein